MLRIALIGFGFWWYRAGGRRPDIEAGDAQQDVLKEIAALDDEDFLKETQNLVSTELDFIYDALDNLGIEYLKSQANFVLVNVGKSADEVFEDLLKQGILVRSMQSYGYSDCIRINVGLHKENARLLEALKVVL